MKDWKTDEKSGTKNTEEHFIYFNDLIYFLYKNLIYKGLIMIAYKETEFIYLHVYLSPDKAISDPDN